MEGWDLHAVVRSGCINEAPTTFFADPESLFAPLGAVEDHDRLIFPEISDTTTVLDELESLYKPFYPVSSQTILSSSMTISVPKELKEPVLQQQSKKEQPATYRRISKKNQQKKVVQHVAGEGHGSDLWAWRKYGQKPIKGSPYPRSYYRCSSSKGCTARKQVERSNLDPGVFIVTYTSEHNHTHPTRRNSLAGSRRSKFPSPEKKGNFSPTTPLMAAAIEDEFVQSASGKNHEEEQIQGNNVISMPDIILDNEIFFPSLEDFVEPAMDGWFLDQLMDDCPLPWFIDKSTVSVSWDANPGGGNCSMGGGAGVAGAVGSGYQSYGASGGNPNTYDGRMDSNRYMQPQSTGGGFTPYGSSGYSTPGYGYGPASNGINYGGYGSYGGANIGYGGPAGAAYGNPNVPNAGYGSVPPGAPRSSWSTQAPSGYGAMGYGNTAAWGAPSGSTGTASGGPGSALAGQSPSGATGYGNQGYGYGGYGGSDGSYGNPGGYGAVGGRSGSVPNNNAGGGAELQGSGGGYIGSGYGDANGNSGYGNAAWRSDQSQTSGNYGAPQVNGPHGAQVGFGGYGSAQARPQQQ